MFEYLIHLKSLLTWSIDLTIFPFFTIFTALATTASWLSWSSPMNFFALKALKYDLIYEKTNSIGL